MASFSSWLIVRRNDRLSRFRTQGIKDADDMSGIILTSFWRHLNDKSIRLDEQIQYYHDLRDLSSARYAQPHAWEPMPQTFADLEDYEDHLPIGIYKTRDLDLNADGKQDILAWSTGGEESSLDILVKDTSSFIGRCFHFTESVFRNSRLRSTDSEQDISRTNQRNTGLGIAGSSFVRTKLGDTRSGYK